MREKEKIEINEKLLESETGYKTDVIFTVIFVIASELLDKIS